ncbi:MAG: twin-arginine translocase subunit TatC [Gammaproteobacteria bacterium]|nr:twin-arginine translocase subunit TatC [Gammaproteobacteria bacterium]MCW8841575.1 twin-arginine translocase subunit TatC [Gammaproteobacteria bacterium]MCW8927577.1 twin-arginine translocase subunit TatC [Gammaproteobacteria bacterium]MCW8958285.1 twin-arginine translocase subunit TatC [Gammaproteobacteria bacterium]MCW8972908.1 twin-arginine translocase subunit TatC [Gammaproteobacteria bacterium]
MTDNSKPSVDTPEDEQPLLTHLFEMRDRLLRVVLTVLLLFVGVFYFANDLYHIVATPLMAHLPDGASMISTKPAGTFFTPMKLALVLSIFLAMPFILYQMWAFVAPGLYTHERKLIIPLLISSTLLFYAGMVFAYYVVFPLMFGFFVNVAPEGVTVMTDISEYLDFVLKIFFAFGVAFEVPIATILLVWTGATTPESLAGKRPYIVVGAFVIGMMLTPPDIISQTLLALPMWVLFEIGLIASRYFLRLKKERQEEEELEDELDSDEEMEAALDRYEAEEHGVPSSPEDDNNKP